MFKPWADKHQPRGLHEIVGQDSALKAVMEWAGSWEKGRPKKPAALFYGPAGTGKTAAVVVLAKRMGWDLIELNASDKRTFAIIDKVAGTAATTGTLLGGIAGKRLVVLDEADNVYGKEDRGGYRAIAKLLEQTQNPTVLIANDRYAIPANVRAMCTSINFRRLTQDAIVKRLKQICSAEKIEADPTALNVIAETARGDLRCAINDLQAVASGKRRLMIKDIILYKRDREMNIFSALSELLRATTCQKAREVMWALDRSPDDAIGWISENVPRMLTDPADLERVCDTLARADAFFGRVKRRQAYGMWSYASDLMSAGVALAREGKLKYVKFQPPSSGMLYRRTAVTRAVRDSLARKIAARCHTSSRVARKHFIPYFSVIFKHNRKASERIAAELELGDAEVGYLVKT